MQLFIELSKKIYNESAENAAEMRKLCEESILDFGKKGNSRRKIAENVFWSANKSAKGIFNHLKKLLEHFDIKPEDIEIEYLHKKADYREAESSDFTLLESNMQVYPLNQILYGPPGTSKTYNTAPLAVSICDGRSTEEVENDGYESSLARYDELMEEGRIKFTTFHQSYGYEEFIEGIKPVLTSDSDCSIDVNSSNTRTIGYSVVPGVFKKFCESASGKSDAYVFIIDEINRGNVSKIFGELITLIEDSKRGKVKAVLPYSGEEFTVPDNVYILGTMNTADRSIALLDTALRRRFSFVEMAPKPELLNGIEVNGEDAGTEGVDIGKMLDIINKRIEFLYDREHRIGHAYFMKLKNTPEGDRLKVLADIFSQKIIPLLQEYFYDDYEKIYLVLNGKLIDRKKLDDANYKLFDNKSIQDRFSEAVYTYSIDSDALNNIESYKQICGISRANNDGDRS